MNLWEFLRPLGSHDYGHVLVHGLGNGHCYNLRPTNITGHSHIFAPGHLSKT